MVVLRPQSEFGHAPPPQTPYSIVTNLPTLDAARRFRDGDMSDVPRMVHLYPRFGPSQYVKQLCAAVSQKLGIEGKGCMAYLNPDMWPYTRSHVANPAREEHAISPDDVELRCVDVAGHRLYLVLFRPEHFRAVLLSWSNPGVGLSIRHAEALLAGVDDMREVPFDSLDQQPPPPPTWTPETAAHAGLKERLVQLMHRAAIDPAKVTCAVDDVYLYPTGMAAVWHAINTMQAYRPGWCVVLGLVFHNTYHHMLEEFPGRFKFFGHPGEQGVDALETWLEEVTKAGQAVSFLFAEVPGNPTVDTADMHRVKALSEKYGFVLIVDDTVASVANVDVLPQSDLVLTSLTKSFNGQADAMGGSIVLNPQSPHHAALSPLYAARFRNELFAADAAVILANSADLLQRTQRLNRNARAMAELLHRSAADPASPIVQVQYPPLLPSRPNYDALLRRATPELPEPAYGCLLTVVFEDLETTTAFYDRCGFYPSPHLGAHVSIQLVYNLLIFGKKPEEREAMREFGVKEEAVRLSAGLEDEQDVIDTLEDALEVAKEAKRNAALQAKK